VLPLLIASGLVLFLEFKPVPSLRDVTPLPHAWVKFFDRQDFFNNVAGFGGFAAAVHWACDGWRSALVARVFRRAAWLLLLVVALECLQVFVPKRSCDWRDMVAGGLGIVIGSLPWLRGGKDTALNGS
jgi:hypothetical protein